MIRYVRCNNNTSHLNVHELTKRRLFSAISGGRYSIHEKDNKEHRIKIIQQQITNNIRSTSSSCSNRRHSLYPQSSFHNFVQWRNIHSISEQEPKSSSSLLFDKTKNSADDDDDEVIVTLLSNGIMKLSFNRPQKANAMGKTMLSQLEDIVTALTTTATTTTATTNTVKNGNNINISQDIRCIILTSCSEKVFSAGADLKERSTMSMEEAASFVTSLRSLLDGLATLPMPMIACVEGAALGGGLEIALTADLIVAGKNAKFGLPETSLAIIPGAGGTQRLPRLIGSAKAKELIFTARKIDAQSAYEYGIVQHVVEAGEAEQKAMDIAEEIARNGPLAVRAAKQSIDEGLNADIRGGMEIEKACYGTIIPTKDRLEGLSAFKEKRKPVYTGN